MRITASDIDNKEFKKGIRGYAVDDVDDFLEQVAEDYEALYKETSMLKEKLSLYEEKIQHYKNMELSIQNTLLLAQSAADDAKKSAQKEAEMIIKNANDSAQRVMDKANNDVIRVNDEYERMKTEFNKFRTKFRNFMNSQMEMFETLEVEYTKSYNIGQNVIEAEAYLEADESDENVKQLPQDESDVDEQKTMEFDLSQFNNNKLNEFDDLENIKTFFAEQ